MKVVVVSVPLAFIATIYQSVATIHDDLGCQVASTGKAILSLGGEQLKFPTIE